MRSNVDDAVDASHISKDYMAPKKRGGTGMTVSDAVRIAKLRHAQGVSGMVAPETMYIDATNGAVRGPRFLVETVREVNSLHDEYMSRMTGLDVSGNVSYLNTTAQRLVEDRYRSRINFDAGDTGADGVVVGPRPNVEESPALPPQSPPFNVPDMLEKYGIRPVPPDSITTSSGIISNVPLLRINAEELAGMRRQSRERGVVPPKIPMGAKEIWLNVYKQPLRELMPQGCEKRSFPEGYVSRHFPYFMDGKERKVPTNEDELAFDEPCVEVIDQSDLDRAVDDIASLVDAGYSLIHFELSDLGPLAVATDDVQEVRENPYLQLKCNAEILRPISMQITCTAPDGTIPVASEKERGRISGAETVEVEREPHPIEGLFGLPKSWSMSHKDLSRNGKTRIGEAPPMYKDAFQAIRRSYDGSILEDLIQIEINPETLGIGEAILQDGVACKQLPDSSTFQFNLRYDIDSEPFDPAKLKDCVKRHVNFARHRVDGIPLWLLIQKLGAKDLLGSHVKYRGVEIGEVGDESSLASRIALSPCMAGFMRKYERPTTLAASMLGVSAHPVLCCICQKGAKPKPEVLPEPSPVVPLGSAPDGENPLPVFGSSSTYISIKKKHPKCTWIFSKGIDIAYLIQAMHQLRHLVFQQARDARADLPDEVQGATQRHVNVGTVPEETLATDVRDAEVFLASIHKCHAEAEKASWVQTDEGGCCSSCIRDMGAFAKVSYNSVNSNRLSAGWEFFFSWPLELRFTVPKEGTMDTHFINPLKVPQSSETERLVSKKVPFYSVDEKTKNKTNNAYYPDIIVSVQKSKNCPLPYAVVHGRILPAPKAVWELRTLLERFSKKSEVVDILWRQVINFWQSYHISADPLSYYSRRLTAASVEREGFNRGYFVVPMFEGVSRSTLDAVRALADADPEGVPDDFWMKDCLRIRETVPMMELKAGLLTTHSDWPTASLVEQALGFIEDEQKLFFNGAINKTGHIISSTSSGSTDKKRASTLRPYELSSEMLSAATTVRRLRVLMRWAAANTSLMLNVINMMVLDDDNYDLDKTNIDVARHAPQPMKPSQLAQFDILGIDSINPSLAHFRLQKPWIGYKFLPDTHTGFVDIAEAYFPALLDLRLIYRAAILGMVDSPSCRNLKGSRLWGVPNDLTDVANRTLGSDVVGIIAQRAPFSSQPTRYGIPRTQNEMIATALPPGHFLPYDRYSWINSFGTLTNRQVKKAAGGIPKLEWRSMLMETQTGDVDANPSSFTTCDGEQVRQAGKMRPTSGTGTMPMGQCRIADAMRTLSQSGLVNNKKVVEGGVLFCEGFCRFCIRLAYPEIATDAQYHPLLKYPTGLSFVVPDGVPLPRVPHEHPRYAAIECPLVPFPLSYNHQTHHATLPIDTCRYVLHRTLLERYSRLIKARDGRTLGGIFSSQKQIVTNELILSEYGGGLPWRTELIQGNWGKRNRLLTRPPVAFLRSGHLINNPVKAWDSDQGRKDFHELDASPLAGQQRVTGIHRNHHQIAPEPETSELWNQLGWLWGHQNLVDRIDLLHYLSSRPGDDSSDTFGLEVMRPYISVALFMRNNLTPNGDGGASVAPPQTIIFPDDRDVDLVIHDAASKLEGLGGSLVYPRSIIAALTYKKLISTIHAEYCPGNELTRNETFYLITSRHAFIGRNKPFPQGDILSKVVSSEIANYILEIHQRPPDDILDFFEFLPEVPDHAVPALLSHHEERLISRDSNIRSQKITPLGKEIN